MLSTLAIQSSRFSLMAAKSTLPRALGATRNLTVGGTFGQKASKIISALEKRKQEKVEEDRYMREQEKKFMERKKKEMAEKMHEQEVAIFQETIAPAMAEAHVLLEKTGDSLSDAGLEAIARWKLDMK